MTSEEDIEVEGKIVAVLPSTMFRVELENGHKVLAHISGKLRKHFIKITVGDVVKMQMSPYDLNRGRIVYRLRNADSNRNAPIRNRKLLRKHNRKDSEKVTVRSLGLNFSSNSFYFIFIFIFT